MWLSNNSDMTKLKLTIALLLLLVVVAEAQNFQEPFADFFSMKECYVITNDGTMIKGKLRGASDSKGFITRLTIVDEKGKKHKFKAAEVKRFAIRPDAFTTLRTVEAYSTSVEHALRTDYNNILDRDWVIYDAQIMPRKKSKVGLLQLLNPGFDQYVKVYHHPNGSKSMGLRIKGVKLLGGKERTYLVVKGEAKPQIVRKGGFKKSFDWMFGDEPMVYVNLDKQPNFKALPAYIQDYNKFRTKSIISEK